MQNYIPKPCNITLTTIHSDKNFWYVEDVDKWLEIEEIPSNLSFSSHYHFKCKTVKALIRKIRKWDLPKNTKIVIYPDDRNLEISFIIK